MLTEIIRTSVTRLVGVVRDGCTSYRGDQATPRVLAEYGRRDALADTRP